MSRGGGEGQKRALALIIRQYGLMEGAHCHRYAVVLPGRRDLIQKFVGFGFDEGHILIQELIGGGIVLLSRQNHIEELMILGHIL